MKFSIPLDQFEPVLVPKGQRDSMRKTSPYIFEAALDAFAQKWEPIYPGVGRIWIRHWEQSARFLQYPMVIRKVIYTTNAIEWLCVG